MHNNSALELITDIANFTNDPYKFVLYAFPWGSGELAKFTGPEEWQAKLLKDIRDGLLTPAQAVEKCHRYSRSSGHGIGKSAFVSWIILWSLSTFEDTKVVVTANTGPQLKTKTWSELSKWHRLCICGHWFKLEGMSLYSIDPKHEKTWRADAMTWSIDNTEAFAGLHNQGKRIVLIFDEASAIPEAIWEVAEGALTDKDTQIFWFAFGNPTLNTGRFHAANFGEDRNLWNNGCIDSRSVSISNKTQIKEWADTYGEDSDFFRVRVKGEPPNSSSQQFIPTSYVDKATGKHLNATEYNFAARIIGVDPGYSGDPTVVYLRQGNMCKLLARYFNLQDEFILAGYISKFEDEYQADAVFVDAGYGTGVVSAGKQLGKNWILVWFGSESSDIAYLNKRTDMWGKMKNWLRDGAAIPDDARLKTDLISPENYVLATGPQAGKINLEKKEDMKARGLDSPNDGDALALTFAFPVAKKEFNGVPGKPEFCNQHDGGAQDDGDPFGDMMLAA